MDGHVHLHGCFDAGRFLDHAAINLARGAEGAGVEGGWKGVLLFSESRGVDRFGELADAAAGTARVGRWILQPTRDPAVLVARSSVSGDGSGPGPPPGGRAAHAEELRLVAGRQIVVRERLEVLALGTRETFPDGRPLADTLDAVRSSGAVPVLPWGFGKWWGRRGGIVEAVVRQEEPGTLLLGDNGCRPRGVPEPRLFRLAGDRGIPVLAGSDPLPFPSQARRVGHYGTILSLPSGPPDESGSALRLALRALRPPSRPFGHREGLAAFGWAQLRIRLPARKAP